MVPLSDDVPAVVARAAADATGGPALEAVRLQGTLALPGATGRPWLVRTATGGALVALGDAPPSQDTGSEDTGSEDTGSGEPGAGEEPPAAAVSLDALDGRARWRSRLMGDRLIVDEQELSVPRGQGSRVRDLLALARLTRWADARDPAPRDLPEGPWISGMPPVLGAWAACRLSPDDAIISVLPTATSAPLSDPWQPEAATAWLWVLTGRRHLLVALSTTGAAVEAPLPDETVVVDAAGHAVAGARRFRLPRRTVDSARRIGALAGVSGPGRLREAARRLARDAPQAGRAHALQLLASAQPAASLDPLRRAVIEGVDGLDPEATPALVEAVDALQGRGVPPQALVAWEESWPVPRSLANALVARLRTRDPAYALSLHEALHMRDGLQRKGPVEADLDADLDLARHLCEARHPDDAAALLGRDLDRLLDRLPPEPEAALLRAGPPDLPLPDDELRAEAVLDTLARARADAGLPVAEVHAARARRAPLDREPLRQLAEDTGERPDLAADARRAAEVLGGQLDGAGPLPDLGPLPPAELERSQHPLAREPGVASRLAGALARVQPPDASALRDYCERLDPVVWPQAREAIARAAVLLGMPSVPAFVSRGERSVGVRAHAEPEPFIVIGHDHLAEGGATLSPAALVFAVGAELAHLRFGHARATADDLWAGLWDKGSAALGVTGALVPLLDVVTSPGRMARLSRAGASAAGMLGTLGQLTGREDEDRSLLVRGLSTDEARLLAVHRLLQLSADRVGLLLCDDPGAAVQAILRQYPRLQGEEAVIAREGLDVALRRTGPDGQLLLPHLAVRVSALLAFWLSPARRRLQAAARSARRQQSRQTILPTSSGSQESGSPNSK